MPSFPQGLHSGTLVPLDRTNIDTDAIFPKQYGRSTARTGYGPVLFDNWRYLDPGDLDSDHSTRRTNPDFILNRADLRDATILLAHDNFGCGSSREHAVWALRDQGFRAVIAPSFGDIFRQNCALNGVAALVLAARDVDALFDMAALRALSVTVDVLAGEVRAEGRAFAFDLTPRQKLLLTQDIDWIGATLAHRSRIEGFEHERLAAALARQGAHRLMDTSGMHTTLISAEELKTLRAAGTRHMVFDCSFDLLSPPSGEEQFRKAHIPGAVYAHLDNALSDLGSPDPATGKRKPHADAASGGRHPLPNREKFAMWLSSVGFANDMQAVVYDRNSAMYCGRLWWMLKWAGHAAVAVLDGGLQAWQAAGGEVTGAVEPSHFQSNFELKPPLVKLATTQDVTAGLGARQVIVDSRATPRYRGEVEPLDPVAGHIPGAINRPFTENIGTDGRFKPREQLRREFDALLQGRDAASVVTHCGSGVSAVPNVIAMELAGLPAPALYAGSWSEWCSDPSRPVEKG